MRARSSTRSRRSRVSPNSGMILTASAYSLQHRKLIITPALQHKLPTVYFLRGFVADGGLVSYGSDTIDLHRRGAGYVDRILKGEKPAPAKFSSFLGARRSKSREGTPSRRRQAAT